MKFILIIIILVAPSTYNKLKAETKTSQSKKTVKKKKKKKKKKKIRFQSDSTEINFDEADIGGKRKTPMSSIIKAKKIESDETTEFIEKKDNWNDKIRESVRMINFSKYFK